MAYLYKHTALQENFAYNLTCLVPGADGQSRSRSGSGSRRSCGTSSTSASRPSAGASSIELEQLRRRIHILEGFRIIFDALDKAIKLIRESDGKAGRRREADRRRSSSTKSRPTPSSTPSSTRSPRWRSRRSSTS